MSDAKMDLLRFVTFGSIDHGKSTLIGRLLLDSGIISGYSLEPIIEGKEKDVIHKGEIDLSSLSNGLKVEQCHGNDADINYRLFSTNKRKFVFSDTPGDNQYTQNTLTAAATADLALVLIDAQQGLVTEACRHTYILNLLGIRHLILAINKMDLVDYEQACFTEIVEKYRDFTTNLNIPNIHAIPLSAINGDNVVEKSARTPWYDGYTLMNILETVNLNKDLKPAPFRMPLQLVDRENMGNQKLSGTVVSGTLHLGDDVIISPSERISRVKTISLINDKLDMASTGQSITITLQDDLEVSKGDLIGQANYPPSQTDQFAGYLLWMHKDPLLPERQYLMKIGPKKALAAVTELKYRINVDTLEHTASKTLKINDIAYCNFALDCAVAFDPYKDLKETGRFILVDRFTDSIVGFGLIDFGLRRATNLTWHKLDVDKETRAKQKNQKACVLWFTGLSGSGKSTVANAIEKILLAMGHHTYILDGDNVRHGLSKDLGFTDADRVENIRRIAEVSKLFIDAGIVVLASFISPFRDERRMARDMLQTDEFIEVFMDTPLDICEDRDPKGLYQKARAGEIKNFTGIDSDYEPPDNPEIILKSTEFSIEEMAEHIVEYLKSGKYI